MANGVICKWQNPDKLGHHKDKKRPNIGFQHPSRAIICGRQNCGKGVAAMNIIAKAEPAFETVCVWHFAPEHTKEWEICDAKMVAECPKVEDFDASKKNCLVIDDINLLAMTRKERGELDRLFSYVSTHTSTTILLCTQDFASIPTSVRRSCTQWILFPSVDMQACRHVSAATGHQFKKLIKLCSSKHDSVCFSFDGVGPALRLNLWTPIEDHGEEDD